MKIGPWDLSLRPRSSSVEATKASGMDLVTRIRASFGYLEEPFSGAWQRNLDVSLQTMLRHPTVWACITQIVNDISKLRIKLVEQNDDRIWTEVDNSAYSPVLRKPNHYQTRIDFLAQWVASKLMQGNTYVLKERDGSQKVRSLYVLDPSKVKVLVTISGDVYYELSTDHISGLTETSVTVPAIDIIHDRMVAPYHPLLGLSPNDACGLSVSQALKIQNNSSRLSENGSHLGGIITAKGPMSDENAMKVLSNWDANFSGPANVGRTALLADGLEFNPLKLLTAVDSQVIEQLKWSDEKICSVYHVPPYMVGVGPMPTFNNIEALTQEYYQRCLQILIESIELLLDEGLGMAGEGFQQFGTELDVDEGLLRMDTAARVAAAGDSIKAGMTINEARQTYFGLPAIAGGETVFLQEQNWPIKLLTQREVPGRQPTAPAALPPAEVPASAKAFDYAAFRERLMAQVEGDIAA